jgi:PKD repeat protein
MKMKNLIKLQTQLGIMLIILSLGLFSACSNDDDDPAPAPGASFQFEVNPDNTLEVTFKNYSANATSYAWDFGDNSGTSTEKDPTYTYADGGTYTVKLTATGEGGSAEHTKEVTVINPQAENLIKNGEFDSAEDWTIIQHNVNNTGTITIANGVATYNQGVVSDWGTEPHVGMYQAVSIEEAGTYMIDMDITTTGISDVWFEVWVGTAEPVADDDYNVDDGAMGVLAFNTWGCPDNATYSGPMAEASCPDEALGFPMDGLMAAEAGTTYYVVIRSGGLNFTDNGIVIDNVKMVKAD